MGLIRQLDTDADLQTLRGTPSWDAIIARIKTNADDVGNFTPAFTMPDSDFVAEDITYDSRGKRFFVTGIRRSVIMSVTPSGAMTTFAKGFAPGWGMLAVAADPARNTLWATAEPLPFSIGYDSAQKGRAAIVKYDLATGALLRRYDLPADARHGAGDIAVAENGDLFVSDGASGALYVIRPDKDLATLVPEGELRSPQGPAISPDGRHVYVADYARGIARVDRSSGEVVWVRHSNDVALNGIDGLSFAGPNKLIAVQNGTNPNRLLAISLDAGGTRVAATSVIAQKNGTIREPTHGVLAGDDYYFIANGGFGAFADDGTLRKGEVPKAPVIMRITGLKQK
jgi:sugar lactone lactonase YvrE